MPSDTSDCPLPGATDGSRAVPSDTSDRPLPGATDGSRAVPSDTSDWTLLPAATAVRRPPPLGSRARVARTDGGGDAEFRAEGAPWLLV